MVQKSSTLPDKTIVDRRRSTRNADLRRTVKSTRRRLTDRVSIDPKFDREMLFMHVRALHSTMAALPLLTMLAAFLSLSIGYSLQMFAWAVGINIAYLVVILLAGKIWAKRDDKHVDIRRWVVILMVVHFLVGLGWMAFVLIPCAECSPAAVSIYKAMTLLVAIAATATIAYSLRWAMLVTFAVPVTVYAVMSLLMMTPDLQMLAGMLYACLGFFTFVALRLNHASQTTMTFETRFDAVIAELEMAKSISDESRRRAEDSNLAKSRFLASMSHELRTPLNAILGFSEVMANEVLGPMENPTYKSYSKDILNSGQHLLNLINEILDLSRIEAGKYDMRTEALRLEDIALDCIGLLRLKAEGKSITLSKSIENGLPQMMADERAVRQIILNLLSNAVKFTPQGGEVTLKVGWTGSGGQYISVIDNGPGIPEEEIPVVLSAFGQGSIAIKNAEQGTGLGLPIVQALIHMHGGKFKLTSELRKGTEAIVMFPSKRVLQPMEADSDAKLVAEKSATPGRRLKVRKKDDNTSAREAAA